MDGQANPLFNWSQPQGPHHGVSLRGRLQADSTRAKLFENEIDNAQPS